MCTGKNCPLKENCFKYNTEPGDYQSWFCKPLFIEGECKEYVYNMKKYDKKI